MRKHPMLSLWLVRCLSTGAMVSCGTPLAAQVIEVGDDGTVKVYSHPAVVTDDEITPIELLARRPIRRPAAASAVPPDRIKALFRSAATDYAVDPRLLHAVAWQESRFRQDAVSRRGAVGVMQLMPATARSIGVDPTDLAQNVRGGAWLLSQLVQSYRGDLSLALAAYNAGPAAVRRYRGIPPFPETAGYVSNVLRQIDASLAATAIHLEKAL